MSYKELQEKKLALELAIKAKQYIKKSNIESHIKAVYNKIMEKQACGEIIDVYHALQLYKDELIERFKD